MLQRTITTNARRDKPMKAALEETTLAADSPYSFERGFPVADTAERAYDASDFRRAIEAYKFFYPTVASEAVMQQGIAAGAKVNEIGIVMATGPRQQFGGANADTPYAITTVDLKAAGPMVVELPPGPFIGFVNDHNMRWVQDMGTIGPEKGQGGKHLILPPDYTGAVPEGYYAGRSKTWKVVVFVRIMPVGGDVAKALQAVNGIKVYPLAKAGQPVTHRFIDVSAETMPLPILNWEDKMDYWRQLHAVIQTETALAEFRPMLGMLASLGIEQGKPFNPDARTQRILEEAARTALAEMRVVFYASRNPAHIAWKDRKWEWFPLRLISAQTGDFGVPALPRRRVQRRIFLVRLRRFGSDRQAGSRRGLGLLASLPRRNWRIPRRRQDLQADRPRPRARETLLVNDPL